MSEDRGLRDEITAVTARAFNMKECPFCGMKYIPVRVHGHQQCQYCGAVVERCCDD